VEKEKIMDYNTKRRELIGLATARFPAISHDIIEDAVQHSFLRYLGYKKPIENPNNLLAAITLNYLKDYIKAARFSDRPLTDSFPFYTNEAAFEGIEVLEKINKSVGDTVFAFLHDYSEKLNLGFWAEKFGIKEACLPMKFSRIIRGLRCSI
jgi:hypothetical protein